MLDPAVGVTTEAQEIELEEIELGGGPIEPPGDPAARSATLCNASRAQDLFEPGSDD